MEKTVEVIVVLLLGEKGGPALLLKFLYLGTVVLLQHKNLNLNHHLLLPIPKVFFPFYPNLFGSVKTVLELTMCWILLLMLVDTEIRLFPCL